MAEPEENSSEKTVTKVVTNVGELATVQQSAQLVSAYANKLLNSEKAQQFATQMRLMISKEPKLAQCTPESLAVSMIACVHLDIMPNTPEQRAYIIPYKNNRLNRYEAQFQMGYKGLIELAYRSNLIKSVSAELVFPQDKFDVDLGMRTLSHKPDMSIDRTNFKDAIAVYAVARLGNGELAFDVLSKSEIDKVRGVVKYMAKDSPWNSWEESMVKKTAVKRLLKFLPSSAEDSRLQQAAMYDSWAEAGKLKVGEDGNIVEGRIQVEPMSAEKQAEVKAEAKSIAADLKNEAAESGDVQA